MHKGGVMALPWIGIAAASTMLIAPVQTSLFTAKEREAVVRFWNEPGRYDTRLPDEAERNGPYQVRLTTAGSIWLREYNKRRGMGKVAPTATAQPQNEQQRDWQHWIDAKIEWDRWQAMQAAEESNRKVIEHATKFDDRNLPKSGPDDPGEAPAELAAFAGEPPAFAEAVVPMLHSISFPDGMVVAFTDNRKMRKNYAYYRFEKGVASEGTAVKDMPRAKLDHLFDLAGVSVKDARVMKSVSILEGGFDAINTYDTGYVSVGFIQFACLKDGGNSLGAMLAQYKHDDPQHFQTDFHRYGIDVTDQEKLACVDPATGSELSGEAAARKLIEDRRLIAVFQYDGLKSDAYNAMQIKAAMAQFYPADDHVTLNVNGSGLSVRVGDVVRSEAGLATLMDRKVNTGHLDPLQYVLQQYIDANEVSSVDDLARYEYDIVTSLRYRKDYLADSSLTQPTRGARSRPLPSRSGGRFGRAGIGGKKGSGRSGHKTSRNP